MKITDQIKKALTRKVTAKGRGPRGRDLEVEVPPSERLVLLVEFAIAMIVSLTVLEIGHLVILNEWNDAIFAALTGMMGTVIGIIVSKKT